MSLQAVKIIEEECQKARLHRNEGGYGSTVNEMLDTLQRKITQRLEQECIELPIPACKSCGVDHDPGLACEDATPDFDARKDDLGGRWSEDPDLYCPPVGRQQDPDDIPF